MATKILGTEVKTGIDKTLVAISGVVVKSSQTIALGPASTTEIKDEAGDTAAVVMVGDTIDISVRGYLAPDSDPADFDPKTVTVTIAGYEIAWIDGVSIDQPEGGGPDIFSCTAHGRNKTAS